ncbi:MAG TPA: sulfatase [bacterium]|nr:sulfatase [bacterium]
MKLSASSMVGFSMGTSFFTGCSGRTRPSQPPNLVFFLVDQLRLQSCGYAGRYADDPSPYTPNLDQLARESMDFRNAVSGSPMCCPFRASLFTGKYPSSTGMVINELRVMPDPDALGHVLTDNGYQTAYIGKWHLFGKDHSPPQQFCPPGAYRLGFDGNWAAHNFHHLYYEGFYYRDTFNRIEIEGYEPHTQTDMAIELMKQYGEAEDPFALFISYGPPHDPWTWDNSPETFNQLFRDKHFPDPPNYADGHALYWSDRRGAEWWMNSWKPNRFQYRQGYAAQTSSMDWELERVLSALDDLGLAENTMFVFTSDHGEMFGSHGRIAKKIFYEEAVRVPFLVRWPEKIPPGQNTACLNTPDIAPTLLCLMNLEVPESMEGHNFSHAALGESGVDSGSAFMQGMGHTFQWYDGDECRAVRTEQFTYAHMLADDSEYLFDNINDPYQMTNLVNNPDFRETYTHLKTEMNKKMEALQDPYRPTTWYRDHWIEDRVIVRSATRELEEQYLPRNIELPHIENT